GIDREGELELDALAESALQQIAEAIDGAVRVDHLEPQHVAPGESEELARQHRAILRRLARAGQQAQDLPRSATRLGELVLDRIEIAEHDRQQIVEIMRHATGELADGVELLGVAQRLLMRARSLASTASLRLASTSSRVRSATRCSSASLSPRSSCSAWLRRSSDPTCATSSSGSTGSTR